MAEARRYSVFGGLFSTITDHGRSIIDLAWTRNEARTSKGLTGLCQQLVQGSGEASNLALAGEVLDGYAALDVQEKSVFFQTLLDDFGARKENLEQAARAFLANPSIETEAALCRLVEPQRRELLRRLNHAPGATLKLVRMREDLLQQIKTNPELRSVDADFAHLFTSWFNRGFLELRRIDWHTPAAILEKIVAYEAVHAIHDWDELRRRIAPADRRLYSFFHPRLPDEPLIFVEVALTESMAASVTDILRSGREIIQSDKARAAMFYSISNCQKGLKGISFGNFLIKQVVAELQDEGLPLRTFATLSPLPTLASWMEKSGDNKPEGPGSDKALVSKAAHYLLNEKNHLGLPKDPVARFHLGNGARLERINWNADLSESGQAQSFGIMVNYLYKLDEIEKNHENFANSGEIAASREVIRLARNVKVPDAASAD